MRTSTRTFDFTELNRNPAAVRRAQLAWDAGFQIIIDANAPEPYRIEVERWLIQNACPFSEVKMRMLG